MEQQDKEKPTSLTIKVLFMVGSALVFLLIGGLVGHFAIPNVREVVVYQNAQYGTFNYSDLQIDVDERTGELSILGLRPGNLWVANVEGFSMWPTIKNGSMVIMEEVQPWDEIKVGDIVAFDFIDSYVVHRVMEIGADEEGWYALTTGDNECEPILSHRCKRSEIWGKVRIYIDY